MARSQREPLFHEAQYQRLRMLADSVNETARTARTTLSLLLLVALYLALTIVASTDENLLRNGQVVLPQVGVGLSIVQSYIFAPLVFMLMHAHALFLLSVLARKVQTFEATVKKELFNARASENDAQTQQNECRGWLSAFAFVQIFQGDAGISNMAKALTWLATSAIPLALLFLIDLSFLRYQSHTITWILHFIFFCDLGLVVLFHWEVFGQRVVKTPKRFGTWAKGLAAGVMVLVLIFAAHPPGKDGSPWSNRTYGKPINFKELFGTLSGLHNLLDVGPCKAWKIGCRYLDVSNLDTKNEKLWLNGRTLRFAKFESAQLKEVNFQGAQLQGANFSQAKLQQADFSMAELQGVDFRQAHLQGADFRLARLQGANFRLARLKGINLQQAWLQCVTGKPSEWRLAWMPGASFDFSSFRNRKSSCSSLPKQLDQCLKEMIPEGVADIKLAWTKSFTLKEHLKKRLKDCPGKRVFDGAKPEKSDMVFYIRMARFGPPKDWPEPVDIKSKAYLNAWREWTVRFACQSVHTARSSFRRWRRDTLGLKYIVSNSASNSARLTVLKALIEKRNDKKNCPGISAIPDDEWKSILDSWKRIQKRIVRSERKNSR